MYHYIPILFWPAICFLGHQSKYEYNEESRLRVRVAKSYMMVWCCAKCTYFLLPILCIYRQKKKKIAHPPLSLSLSLFLSMSLKHTPAICGVTKGFEHKAKYVFLYVSCISEYTRTLFFFWIMTVNDVRHASVIMPDPPSTLVASTPDGRAHYSRRLLNVRDLFGPVVWRKNKWVVSLRTASDDQIGSRVTLVFVFFV